MEISIIVKAALPIIFANEGNYSSVNPDDNGAVSVGKIQWHANRALNLLKKIVAADKTEAKKLLGNALYDEITTSLDWKSRVLTSKEANRISSLLATDQSKTIQDKQASSDVSQYLAHGINLGLRDGKTLVYHADVENQGGSRTSERIGIAAVAKAGAAPKVNLEIYHNCALTDRVMKKYSTRRKKVYKACKAINFSKYNPYPKPDQTLSKGDQGPEVSWVQWELNQAGITSVTLNGKAEALEIDGSFGSITEGGVKLYQRTHKLQIDGIVGRKTKKSFEND